MAKKCGTMAKGGTSNPLGYFNDLYDQRKKSMSGSSMMEAYGGPGDRRRRRSQNKRARQNFKKYINRRNRGSCGPGGCN
jgi:hypothetical protein